VSHSKTCFETICRLYYVRHGFEKFDSYMIQFLIHLGNMAIECLKTNPPADVVDGIQSTALLCVKGINDQAAGYCAAEAAFIIMEKRLDPTDMIRLRTMLSKNESPKDKQAIEELVNSKWPIPIIYADGDPRSSYLETLVKSTVALSVAEGKKVADFENGLTSNGRTDD
jgi:hypothetical protein